MSALLSVPPRVALVVSTSGIDSVMVIVSATAPGCSDTSTRISLPTSNTTFWRSMVLKPLASTRTLYVPGLRVGALYSPASFVTRVFVTPLSVSMTVTVAPDTTPPLWSVTVPMIRPALPCENSGRQSRSIAIAPHTSCAAFRNPTPQDLLLVEFKELISRPPVQNGESRTWPRASPLVRSPTAPTLFRRAHASLETLRFHPRGGKGLKVNVQHIKVEPLSEK